MVCRGTLAPLPLALPSSRSQWLLVLSSLWVSEAGQAQVRGSSDLCVCI